MTHSIKKCMSNTLSNMKILQRLGYANTNLCPLCYLDMETIQNLYQCNHYGIRVRWTASVDALRKWLEARKRDPDIAIILVDTILYIIGEINNLPQCPNITLHSDILHILRPSIILGFIPTFLARTQQTYFTHIGSKQTALKWASQLITQIWKLIYGQWLHRSKFNHKGEVLEYHTRDLILDS